MTLMDMLTHCSTKINYWTQHPMQSIGEFFRLNEEAKLKKKTIKFELQAVNTKLEKLEEKFIFDSITETIYKKHLAKLTIDKNILLKDLENPFIKLSNLTKYVNLVTRISSNLLSMWGKEIYEEQVKIQNFLFPEGIRYNREKGIYRTLRVNTFLSLNNLFSDDYRDKKQSRKLILNKNSAFVPKAGIEPALPKELVFETSASTNSAIWACAIFFLRMRIYTNYIFYAKSFFKILFIYFLFGI